ncbi:MAG: ArsR/SmtB family transcription factor [Acidimicrobiales bacterium]
MTAAPAMDATARAVADPTRRTILRLVHDEEHTVTDIAAHFEVSRPAISQHLRVLHDADLVTIRQEGTRRYYRTRPEGLADLRLWLDEFWSTRLDDLKRVVETDNQ